MSIERITIPEILDIKSGIEFKDWHENYAMKSVLLQNELVLSMYTYAPRLSADSDTNLKY